MEVTLPAKWCITLVCFKCGAEVIPAVNNAIQCTTVTLDGGQDELIDTLNIIWIYIAAVVHQQDKQLWYLASKRVQKRLVFHTSVHVIIQAGSFISIFAATKVNRMLRQYFRSGGHLREVWVEVCQDCAAKTLKPWPFSKAPRFSHTCLHDCCRQVFSFPYSLEQRWSESDVASVFKAPGEHLRNFG